MLKSLQTQMHTDVWVLVPHLPGRIVEGGVMRASAAVKTKLLLVSGLCHFHSHAARRDLRALIHSAGYTSEVGWSN